MILQKATKGTKERGILFRGEMVRAILDGRKTQTRRVGKIQSESYTELGVEYSNHATKGREAVATYRAYPDGGTARWGICACPHGKPGDGLWVRESWDVFEGPNRGEERLAYVRYAADAGLGVEDREVVLTQEEEAVMYHYGLKRGWKPGIHMPRWASRITLEILKVRVERVAEISVKDAIAEGIELAGRDTGDVITAFRKLWDTMRAGTEFEWDKNPWVWVIEFERAGG